MKKPYRIYIIGSVLQANFIKKLADYIKEHGNFEVEYVRRQSETPLKELIHNCFHKIESADLIIAVEKRSGGFGDGTLYELEYANRLSKMVMKVSPHEKISDIYLQLYS